MVREPSREYGNHFGIVGDKILLGLTERRLPHSRFPLPSFVHRPFHFSAVIVNQTFNSNTGFPGCAVFPINIHGFGMNRSMLTHGKDKSVGDDGPVFTFDYSPAQNVTMNIGASAGLLPERVLSGQRCTAETNDYQLSLLRQSYPKPDSPGQASSPQVQAVPVCRPVRQPGARG